ncbi:MAG: hypothetical protein ACYCT1_05055 [Steroidobacteraceae bacterium]
MSAVDRWWETAPGIDPRDYAWIAAHENELTRPTPDVGPCFAFWQIGEQPAEQLGPFPSRSDADSALDAKLAELDAAGVDIADTCPRMSVIFADPATYLVPPNTGKHNA